MAVNLSPLGGVGAQFFDSNGNPLSGGLIYTYAAGTNTPQATYTSASGIIQHSNPIVLDAAGRVPTGEIWLTDGVSYKFVIQTSAAVLVGTYDNIVGINSNFVAYTSQQEIQTATAGQTVFTLATMQYQPGTNNLAVYVDGVNQYGPGAQYAYVETDSSTVTFVSGLHVGASVKFTTASPVSSTSTDAQNVSYTPPFTDSVTTSVQNKLAQYVSAIDFGAVADFGVTPAATNNAAIQLAVDAFTVGGGVVLINKGIEWGPYNAITIPDEVEIIDESGWDYVNDQWTAQVKLLLKTADPGTKNANEYIVGAPYHPAVVLDNLSGGTDYRGSLVMRQDGATDWQIGTEPPSSGSTARRLNYAYYGTYAGTPAPGGTNVFGIDPKEGNFGFNSLPTSGVDYLFYSCRNNEAVYQYLNPSNHGWDIQYKNATNGLLTRFQVSGVDGNFNYQIGSLQFGYVSALGEQYGYKNYCSAKTTTTFLNSSDIGKIFNNDGSSGSITIVLPVLVKGMEFTFYVTAGNNLRIEPQPSAAFRGFDGTSYSSKANGKWMESSTVGSYCVVRAVQGTTNTWEFQRFGTWTDEP